MTTVFNRKKNGPGFAPIARRAGYLWLLCICFGVFPILANPVSHDLVYCPLQKAWVKKSGETPKPDALKSVCASDAAKERFFYESSRRSNLSSVSPGQRELQELFFNYSKTGKIAFGKIGSGVPERQNVNGSTAGETSLANGQARDDSSPAQPLAAHQITFRRTSDQVSTERPAIFDPKTLNHTTSPRGPPASLQ